MALNIQLWSNEEGRGVGLWPKGGYLKFKHENLQKKVQVEPLRYLSASEKVFLLSMSLDNVISSTISWLLVSITNMAACYTGLQAVLDKFWQKYEAWLH